MILLLAIIAVGVLLCSETGKGILGLAIGVLILYVIGYILLMCGLLAWVSLC